MVRDVTLLDGTIPTALQGPCHPLETAPSVGYPRALRPLLLGLACCGLCAGSAALWHVFGPPLLLNVSPSVPRGLYVVTPLATPTRGMLVVFPPPPAVAALLVRRGYLAPHTPLLKPVAALPGETVCVQEDGVVIAGIVVAPVATVDRLGRPLPPWRGCVTLGAGEVFPLSLAPRSFDGRYFGPVPLGSLLGQAQPLWTWGGGAVRVEEGERGQDKDEPGGATLPKQNQALGTRQAPIFPAERLKALWFQTLAPRHNAMAGEERGHAD